MENLDNILFDDNKTNSYICPICNKELSNIMYYKKHFNIKDKKHKLLNKYLKEIDISFLDDIDFFLLSNIIFNQHKKEFNLNYPHEIKMVLSYFTSKVNIPYYEYMKYYTIIKKYIYEGYSKHELIEIIDIMLQHGEKSLYKLKYYIMKRTLFNEYEYKKYITDTIQYVLYHFYINAEYYNPSNKRIQSDLNSLQYMINKYKLKIIELKQLCNYIAFNTNDCCFYNIETYYKNVNKIDICNSSKCVKKTLKQTIEELVNNSIESNELIIKDICNFNIYKTNELSNMLKQLLKGKININNLKIDYQIIAKNIIYYILVKKLYKKDIKKWIYNIQLNLLPDKNIKKYLIDNKLV